MNAILELSNEDKELLFEVVCNQYYALELVGAEIADLESGRKKADEARLKKLNDLYDRLVKAGF